MKAVLLQRHGGPEVLRISNVPTPVVAAGQVAVAVEAVGINYAEVLSRKGAGIENSIVIRQILNHLENRTESPQPASHPVRAPPGVTCDRKRRCAMRNSATTRCHSISISVLPAYIIGYQCYRKIGEGHATLRKP